MLSVSKLGRKFGLSRATILYYEKEGLLEPAVRAANGYRYYGEEEIERLRRITGYRSYGVPVSDIRELLQRESNAEIERVLRKRFDKLEQEIGVLREQQRALVRILERSDLGRSSAMTKERWTAIMRAAGMSDEDMYQWHREFEFREPDAHREFLESLNIGAEEIERIRDWSRN
ncbi:MAG: MerR family transcriptional regulator [Xanthomonadales bacterium]|nr:MerR family transcriptional regulator [Xanthomonadales bacterium]NIX12823.1 MerR family transcriptional regulator [Xanthomonadales bacterium]